MYWSTDFIPRTKAPNSSSLIMLRCSARPVAPEFNGANGEVVLLKEELAIKDARWG